MQKQWSLFDIADLRQELDVKEKPHNKSTPSTPTNTQSTILRQLSSGSTNNNNNSSSSKKPVKNGVPEGHIEQQGAGTVTPTNKGMAWHYKNASMACTQLILGMRECFCSLELLEILYLPFFHQFFMSSL